MRVRWLLGGVLTLLPAAARAHGMGAEPETAAAGTLLLWLCLFGACGLLLFWGLPVAIAALVAQRRGEHPVAGLLWAGFLGWPGLLIFFYRRAEKRCPHCHTGIVREAAHCYWCGGDTRPAPLPEFARQEWGWE
jgi:hypothetical protein